jgi:hypothetical protein
MQIKYGSHKKALFDLGSIAVLNEPLELSR